MRAHFASCAISLTVHLIIAGAFLCVPMGNIVRQKSIALDFTIVKGYESGKTGLMAGHEKKMPGEKERVESNRAAVVEKKAEPVVKRDNINPGRQITGEEAIPGKEKGIAGKDDAGQVSVAGVRQADAQPPPGTSGAEAAGRGGKGVKILNYSGPGGVDERHFSFIRERIIGNIIYPERARRMGWEGRVTISFTVRENGSIGDVKILSSSGFPVLDENARDAVARTNFKRKVPVRLVVLLPVEYKLR